MRFAISLAALLVFAAFADAKLFRGSRTRPAAASVRSVAAPACQNAPATVQRTSAASVVIPTPPQASPFNVSAPCAGGKCFSR